MEAHAKRYNPKFICCNDPMRDWSGYDSHLNSLEDHLYCPHCCKHIYRGKTYSAKEWYAYVNSESKANA